MPNKLRIVLAQLNLKVGDVKGNLEKHLKAAITARDNFSAQVIVFPELSLTGYPPEDLLFRQDFITEANNALKKFNKEIKGIYCLIGHPHILGQHLFNACSLFYDGHLIGRYKKQCLPNYSIFDERRYFTAGEESCVIPIHGVPTGLVICEDLWRLGPTQRAVSHGAKMILAPNASPFEINKHEQRISVLNKRAQHEHVPIFYANHVSGQDELVFDGGSMAVDAKGNLAQFAGFFNETLLPVDVDIEQFNIAKVDNIIPEKIERIYQALVLSVRDYVEKNNFPSVIVAISGGIDSALTLAIAVDAIGKDRVRAVYMPSRFSAEISQEDALELVKHLSVELEIISIEPLYQSFLDSLASSFAEKKNDVTEENIQARCRAVLIMALSNKYGHLVLTTGNRSEMAVGYCTLYGDMAGGFAVLKDVPKTLVYELATYKNKLHYVIPQRTIDRPPTAELAPDQKDEDSLPPYSVLDRILEYYLNQTFSLEEIVARGFERDVVMKVIKLIHRSEYKRKQAAIGPHINHKSFGRDWRYPITNGFKG